MVVTGFHIQIVTKQPCFSD